MRDKRAKRLEGDEEGESGIEEEDDDDDDGEEEAPTITN